MRFKNLRLLILLVKLHFRIKRRRVPLDALFSDEKLKEKYRYKAYWTKRRPEGDSYDILQAVLNEEEKWNKEKEGFLTVISLARNNPFYGFMTATFLVEEVSKVSILYDRGEEAALEIASTNNENIEILSIALEGNAIFKGRDGARGYRLA